jgi:hypothetical protein
LSAARLEDLRAMLPADKLASLIEDCLVDLSERLVSLQVAIQAGVVEQIVAHTHAIAGMAAEYGMAALEARVRTLMRLARDEPASVAAVAGELEAEVFRAGTALRGALQIEMV